MLLLRSIRDIRGPALSWVSSLPAVPSHADAYLPCTQSILGECSSTQNDASCNRCFSSTASTSGQTLGPFEVEVSVKAFEPRYVKRASTVIRDLMMINVAPKPADVAQRGRITPLSPSPSNLVIPNDYKEVNVNWKRTRFTVIRGPHIDKIGMEQFERRQYKAVLKVASNSADEVRWLLDHLKLYEFTGTQLKVVVGSSCYLSPTIPEPSSLAAISSANGDNSVLAQHRQHISRYLGPVQATTPVAAEVQEVGEVLTSLKGVLRAGLEKRRVKLASDAGYQSWHYKQKRVQGSTSSSNYEEAGLTQAGSEGLSPQDPNKLPPLQDEQRKQAAAFMEAVDAALLDVKLGALESHRSFPFHFATFAPGSGTIPAAQWMQAVLKMGQYQKKLAETPSNQAKLLKLYCGQNQVTHVLQYELLKSWGQQVVADMKSYLALPKAATAKAAGGGAAAGAAKKAD